MQIQSNGLHIEVDDQGPVGGEPLLLIMGLGMQLLGWPQELVDALVSNGFRVIRMDNRDVGLSQGFDHAGVPSLIRAGLRYALHLPVDSPYPLKSMADDALGVLDALHVTSAHVCGASMGGMIAQHLAAVHPGRVRSLALMMTSSGARSLPQPKPALRRALLRRPKGGDVEAAIAHLERLLHLIGSPAYRPDPRRQRERLEQMVRRAWRPQGTARQLLAIVADGDRSSLLRHIVAPTRIIHGEADPLVPVAAAYDLVRKIAGAQLDVVPGMGHDLPLALLPRLAASIAENASRVRSEPR
jgi:pimeloyl-ACP methyl ester carboxylesterase